MSKEYEFTSTQLNKMKHCIKLDDAKYKGIKHRKIECYRNYFCAGGKDIELLQDLEKQGLMHSAKSDYIDSKSVMFYITTQGLEYLSKLVNAEITIRR